MRPASSAAASNRSSQPSGSLAAIGHRPSARIPPSSSALPANCANHVKRTDSASTASAIIAGHTSAGRVSTRNSAPAISQPSACIAMAGQPGQPASRRLSHSNGQCRGTNRGSHAGRNEPSQASSSIAPTGSSVKRMLSDRSRRALNARTVSPAAQPRHEPIVFIVTSASEATRVRMNHCATSTPSEIRNPPTVTSARRRAFDQPSGSTHASVAPKGMYRNTLTNMSPGSEMPQRRRVRSSSGESKATWRR